MKRKLFIFLSFLTLVVIGLFAQYYQIVQCYGCGGTGGYMSYWGPVYCQICWGKGYITVPVQQNNPAFQGNKVAVEVTGVDCKGHAGSLCSCTTYKGYRIAGTNNYTGACQNYVNGHKCGHGPSAHGL